MLNRQQCRIIAGNWNELGDAAQAVREAVFIQEQQIAPEEEWDAEDAISLHFVAYLQDQPVATARLLKNNSIGRVAVMQSARGLGLGRQIMQAVIDQARAEQRESVKLSAQVHAIGFYQGLGFEVQGEQYLDCGIPHIDMYLALKD